MPLPAYANEAQRLLDAAPSSAPRSLHVCAGSGAWSATQRLRSREPDWLTGLPPIVVCLPPGRPWSCYRWGRLVAEVVVWLDVYGQDATVKELADLAFELLCEGAKVVYLRWSKTGAELSLHPNPAQVTWTFRPRGADG